MISTLTIYIRTRTFGTQPGEIWEVAHSALFLTVPNVSAANVRYDTMRDDANQKLTNSQINLPHGTKKR